MSAKKVSKKTKRTSGSTRTKKSSRAKGGKRSTGGSLEGLISTAVAGLQAFAREMSSESREYLIREASEFASSALNSDVANDAKEMLYYWYSGKGADEFGKDPTFMEFLRPLFQFLYYTYFRVDVSGIRNVPRGGPAILVANHAGTLPYDGAMVHLAVYNELAGQREVRFLVDDFIYNIPLLGTFIERIGGMRACHENAQSLLDAGHMIVVFPEGVNGIGKPYDERYRIGRFGKGGFIKLALNTGFPVIPVAIVGSEETHPIIWKSERMGRKIGFPFIPFTPTFPWLGPLGLVPLPSKWKITFGRVHRFDRFKPKDAENEKLVNSHAEEVRREVQEMLDKTLARRKNVWI